MGVRVNDARHGTNCGCGCFWGAVMGSYTNDEKETIHQTFSSNSFSTLLSCVHWTSGVLEWQV